MELNSTSVYNTRKIIKPYELDVYFPEYKLAFEYNGKGWHTNDKINKDELCSNIGIKLFTIIENNRKYELDIKNQLVNIIDKINILTNKKISENDIASIVVPNTVFDNILDDEYIKNICSKYTDYHLFITENVSLYHKLTSMKKIIEYTSHMKKVRKWNEEMILEEISKYEYLGDLIKNSRLLYVGQKK